MATAAGRERERRATSRWLPGGRNRGSLVKPCHQPQTSERERSENARRRNKSVWAERQTRRSRRSESRVPGRRRGPRRHVARCGRVLGQVVFGAACLRGLVDQLALSPRASSTPACPCSRPERGARLPDRGAGVYRSALNWRPPGCCTLGKPLSARPGECIGLTGVLPRRESLQAQAVSIEVASHR